MSDQSPSAAEVDTERRRLRAAKAEYDAAVSAYADCNEGDLDGPCYQRFRETRLHWLMIVDECWAALLSSADRARELEAALRSIKTARDYCAKFGDYPEGTVRPDQCFDDWAADIASAALSSAGDVT